ncbi:MAG TPA: ABC transporter substrate-binding protein [Candidatus Pelethocola excrementipullorum]|nr:ABC transporter substrate-binding protein [Candidatus Pelethocola excrementipullorum]
MKRKIAILLTVAMGIASLAACGGDGDKTSGGESDKGQASTSGGNEEATRDGKKEITFWHYMSEDKEGKYVMEAVDEFNNSQDEIYVNAQYLPREELMKQYSIGVVSGELPDCGMVDNPDHNSYASMGVFEDITDLYDSWDEADFLEGSLNSCKYEDKLYGIPWGNNCLGLFYDKDMLEAAGVEVPTTWSELEAACEQLSKDDVKGLAISAIGNEEGTFQFMPWLLSAGGDINNLSSDSSKEAVTYLKNLMDKGYIGKECVNWTQADAEKQFASGQAAMMINGPWQFSGLKDDAPDKNYGVAKVPKADDGDYASVLGGENVAICKGADVESSWTFLTYMTNKENSPKICKEIGRFSPRADVDVQEMFKDDPLNSVFADLMPQAQSRGPSPKWPEISAAIYTAEQEVFTGQKDVDTAMADAQAKVDGINESLK